MNVAMMKNRPALCTCLHMQVLLFVVLKHIRKQVVKISVKEKVAIMKTNGLKNSFASFNHTDVNISFTFHS